MSLGFIKVLMKGHFRLELNDKHQVECLQIVGLCVIIFIFFVKF